MARIVLRRHRTAPALNKVKPLSDELFDPNQETKALC
jgi:hypothetical protein